VATTEFDFDAFFSAQGYPNADPLWTEVLLDPISGIFHGVDCADLSKILDSARVRWVAKGKPVSTESELRNEVSVYVILSGECGCFQTIVADEAREVAVYGPGDLMNDVAAALIGVRHKKLRLGKDGHALATWISKKGCYVLEIPNPSITLWQSGCIPMLVNLGRILSIKVVNRNADFNKTLMGESERMANAIKQIIQHQEPRTNPFIDPRERREYIYDVGIRRIDFARKIRLPQGTVYSFCVKLYNLQLPQYSLAKKSFSWDGQTIEMSKEMQKVILLHTDKLFEPQNWED